MTKIIILSFLVLSANLYSQSFDDFMHKRQIKSMDHKASSHEQKAYEMELTIKTDKGEVPARLRVFNNLGYKLEILTKENKSAEIMNTTAYYLLDINGKPTTVHQNQSFEYLNKKWLMLFDEIEDMTRSDFPKDRIEIFGTGDYEGRICQLFKLRDENPEVYSVFYFDIEHIDLVKRTTNYMSPDGVQREDIQTYANYKVDKDIKRYPTEFSTVLGKATVKSIKLISNFNIADFQPK